MEDLRNRANQHVVLVTAEYSLKKEILPWVDTMQDYVECGHKLRELDFLIVVLSLGKMPWQGKLVIRCKKTCSFRDMTSWLCDIIRRWTGPIRSKVKESTKWWENTFRNLDEMCPLAHNHILVGRSSIFFIPCYIRLLIILFVLILIFIGFMLHTTQKGILYIHMPS